MLRLEPGGCGPRRSAWWPPREMGGHQLRSRYEWAGGEASGKVCGVPLAMLPGQSRAPPPRIGEQWTWEPSAVALPPGSRSGAGQVRRRPTAADGAEAP